MKSSLALLAVFLLLAAATVGGQEEGSSEGSGEGSGEEGSAAEVAAEAEVRVARKKQLNLEIKFCFIPLRNFATLLGSCCIVCFYMLHGK